MYPRGESFKIKKLRALPFPVRAVDPENGLQMDATKPNAVRLRVPSTGYRNFIELFRILRDIE